VKLFHRIRSAIRPSPAAPPLAAGRRGAVLAAVLAAALSACDGSPGSEQRGPLSLDQLAGHTVFVNYWAEWCQPCREEIPELNEFQQRHSDSVRVVGVNFDQLEGETLAGQVQRLGIDFPTLDVDPRAALGVPVPVGLPETFVIDGEGKLVSILRGPQTLESLEQALALASGEEG